MANIRSAEKRNRQAQKRRTRNVQVRSTLKSAVKKARDSIGKGDTGAQGAIKTALRALDRAASKGVIHRNTAARRIGRLAKAVAKAGARPAEPASSS